MPDGMRRMLECAQPLTMVCPALVPPLQRATTPRLLGKQVHDLALCPRRPTGNQLRLLLAWLSLQLRITNDELRMTNYE